MWQERFARLAGDDFTIVGVAMDVEGAAAAKQYYEKYGVKFHALADPNYATRFGFVPYTFFVNEHGVVQGLTGWEKRVTSGEKLRPVTDDVRRRFTAAKARSHIHEITRLSALNEKHPHDLATATALASRHLDAQNHERAREVLRPVLEHFDALRVARGTDNDRAHLLASAHLQFARANPDSRETQIQHLTTSFYLNPSIGFGKQISRVMAPEKFDGRPDGRFDNRFREATLRQLQQQRRNWLADEK